MTVSPLTAALSHGVSLAAICLVFLAALPLAVAAVQFALLPLHRRHDHLADTGPHYPNVAVLIPAWNEEAVLAAAVGRFLELNYPPERLRVYVVDDASTDGTPDVCRALAETHPGRVFHLRRENGGQGKAHTLNHGLSIILADPWMQAVLITDADPIFQPDALARMTRHLADPRVGAVTAYITEGSDNPSGVTRSIAYEYAIAQAAGRRTQNVMGAMACLAGGAQLHSRANIEGIGGQIDTATLAEDTVTTFTTQMQGRKVVFDGRAVVYAEEPGDITALWKQRLRWSRGNVQVSRRFWRVLLNPRHESRLGRPLFAAAWFCLLLQPFLMIAASVALVTLYLLNPQYAWSTFRALWVVNLVSFAFITVNGLLIDPATARRSWRQALSFPGVVSVLIMLRATLPHTSVRLLREGEILLHLSRPLQGQLGGGWVLFSYGWLALCMLVAWLAKLLSGVPGCRWLSRLLLALAGYGALLCANTLAAHYKEWRNAAATWDKTEKVGSVSADNGQAAATQQRHGGLGEPVSESGAGALTGVDGPATSVEAQRAQYVSDLAADQRFERSLLWRGLVAWLAVGVVAALHVLT